MDTPTQRRVVKWGVALLIVAVALTSGVACGGEEEPDYGGGDAGAATDSAKKIEITASDFSFAPATLTAKQGEPFDLILTNAGATPHTFTVDELNIDAEVDAGEEMTVPVTPSDSGDFTFYCRFHQQQGMEGDISVGGGAADAGEPDPTEPPADDDSYYGY